MEVMLIVGDRHNL